MVSTYMVKQKDGNYRESTQTEKLEYLNRELIITTKCRYEETLEV